MALKIYFWNILLHYTFLCLKLRLILHFYNHFPRVVQTLFALIYLMLINRR